MRNKRVFISLSHQECCEKLEFLEAGYRKLHEYAIITSHAPGSKWEPKVQYNPGGAFCNVSIRVVLSSSAESEYENRWKKQYSPAGRLADICKAIPQHNYLWTSGPCKHRAIFFSHVFISRLLPPLWDALFYSLLPFAAHVRIHSFYCPSATSHARVCALSLEFHDFINSASAYLQHCSHCFPSHSMWSPLRPQTSSLLSFSSTVVEQFYSCPSNSCQNISSSPGIFAIQID